MFALDRIELLESSRPQVIETNKGWGIVWLSDKDGSKRLPCIPPKIEGLLGFEIWLRRRKGVWVSRTNAPSKWPIHCQNGRTSSLKPKGIHFRFEGIRWIIEHQKLWPFPLANLFFYSGSWKSHVHVRKECMRKSDELTWVNQFVIIKLKIHNWKKLC